MEQMFAMLPISGYGPDVVVSDGVLVETLRYRVTPRPSSKFRTLLDPAELFGASGTQSTVRTVVRDGDPREVELQIEHELRGFSLSERLVCDARGDRLRGRTLTRHLSTSDEVAREELVAFDRGPIRLPATTYPEVMLPFLMRGQPRDGQRRAAWSWTNDRFVARVYYERRKTVQIVVPAGHFEAELVWMYPDLNDWIALGNVVTRLVKPLIPRYDIWFESRSPYRVLRFEGPYGPPGAPEVVLELSR